jgi:hypothetical protein
MNPPRRSSPKKTKSKQAVAKPDRRVSGGGPATGGGVNFQAVVTAVAGVHLLRGTPIGWLNDEAADTPVSVWAETNGPGDDVRLELGSGSIVEIQAKKGLKRGKDLWDSLIGMARAVKAETIHYGVLAVAPDSSGTICKELPQDVRRLADGRDDYLSAIGQEFLRRLTSAKLPISDVCRRLRIRVVHGIDADGVEIRAAQDVLRQVCANEGDAEAAWDAIYRDAIAIIERRGRWRLIQLVRLLAAKRIDIQDAEFPAAVTGKLAAWTVETNDSFSIAGVPKRLGIEALLRFRTVKTSFQKREGEDAQAALKRYHSSGERRPQADELLFDAEWTARFYWNTVVVAGPGLGKSTLMTKLAHTYASDGYPVLKLSLKSVAASMRNGATFDDSLRNWGLDGSGISPEMVRKADLREWVILADGLDECGDHHEQVASGLARFAKGYSAARVVVTTRPIGYDTVELADWCHHTLLAPDKDNGEKHLATLIRVAADNDAVASRADEIAKRELSNSGASTAIVASPLMLAMAASQIVLSGRLPQSRLDLYERMISFFEKSPKARGASLEQSPAEVNRVLDILGWRLTCDPLAGTTAVLSDCARVVATELGVTPLVAKMRVQAAIQFWERVGLVEQLFQGGATLLTFVHTTFSEFAAARLLKDLPDSDRRQELERVVDLPGWHEVVSFAGGLGVGDEIAGIFAARCTNGRLGQFELALALIGDSEIRISDKYASELIEGAFAAIERGEDDNFDLGLALADLSTKRQDVMGLIAKARLSSKNYAVRLAAWACAVGCGISYYDPATITSALRDLVPHISQETTLSPPAAIRANTRKDSNLIRRVGLAALETRSCDSLETYIENELSHPAFEQPGACEGAHGGFTGAVDAERREALDAGDGPVEEDGSVVVEERQRLLHGEEGAAHVEAEGLVEVLFSDLFERGQLTLAGAGEEDVDLALFTLDGLVEAVEVGEIGGVALHAGDVPADELHGLIELLLTASGDEDICALFHEELCCCERHS